MRRSATLAGVCLFGVLGVEGCDNTNSVTGPNATPVTTAGLTRVPTPPSLTPTPVALVYASGLVSRRTGVGVVSGLGGATVTLTGPGFNFVTTSRGDATKGDGHFEFPPFPANQPIILSCSLPGWQVIATTPDAGFAPTPGVWPEFGCLMGPPAP